MILSKTVSCESRKTAYNLQLSKLSTAEYSQEGELVNSIYAGQKAL